jgi:DNA polymerase III alpha subunit
VIPIFKSRYSLARSILDISEDLETKLGHADNILDLIIKEGLDELVLVEDTMANFIIAYNACKKHKIKLRFGLRLNFCSDIENPKSEELHKNILFLKENKGYESLVKCSTFAFTHPFGGEPLIDYNYFHEHREGLELVVPFYDSFIWKNNTEFASCIPDYRNLNPTFLVERNGLPEDGFIEDLLKDKPTQLAKSIYYKDRADVHSFVVRKLIDKKEGKKKTLEVPNLDGFCSSEFSFESWKEYVSGV